MALFRCSSCGGRPVGRVASSYWFRIEGDGSRNAWKTRWCKDCWDGMWADVLEQGYNVAEYESVATGKCPKCETAEADEGCEIYGTCYVPNQEPMRVTMELCRKCHPGVMAAVTKGSTPLLDRGLSGPSAVRDAWSA